MELGFIEAQFSFRYILSFFFLFIFKKHGLVPDLVYSEKKLNLFLTTEKDASVSYTDLVLAESFSVNKCCLWKSIFIYCFNCETYFITDFKIITDNKTKLRLFRSTSSQIGLRFHILIFPLKRRNVTQILNRWSLLCK